MIAASVDHPGGSYEVRLGPVERAFEAISALAGNRPVPLVSDSRVHELYGHRFADIALVPPILVPRGEAAKDWRWLRYLVEQFAALGVDRNQPVMALGGGSVGDLTALAASIFKRGCPVIHVPTTLLSQVDSAIGGKTAIDAAGTKNLVGTFHHPALVVVDPSFVDSLEPRALRSGFAEIVKYGLIDRPDFFEWCETNGEALLAGSVDARKAAIRHCIQAKAKIVSADPEDRNGKRSLLNLGHTFGHAIEAVAGLGTVEHGEAVALGMALAFGLSVELGLCPDADRERVVRLLQRSELPSRLSDLGLSGPDLLDAMERDKKNIGGGLSLILVRGIGRAFLATGVDRIAVRAFLARAR